MKRLCATRPTAAYLAGATAARTGDEISGPALLLAGYAVTGSAAEASALLAGITIAAAVGGPPAGALLDRAVRPGRLLAVALALYATGLVTILAVLGRVPLPFVVLAAVTTGLLGPALSGGWTAQLPRVAASGTLPRANALDAMTYGVAGLTGPALAGVAAQLFGPSAGLAVSVSLIGLALPVAWGLPSAPGSAARAEGSVTADLLAGARHILRNRPLARVTLTSVVSCTGQGMLIACVPLLGERVLGEAAHGTMLLSCTAVSALATNAVLARFPPRCDPDTLVWAGALLRAVAPALAATGRPVAVLAAVLVAGIGEGPQLTALFAVRHREAPERLRGQIFTTGASLKITGFAVGAGLAGPLTTWSLAGALLTAAGVELLAVLAFFTLVRRLFLLEEEVG
ncbi:MFS transporter [Streptomyces sp. AK08-02]|uniref:MFS transporter n=1 Tax=Streptomyces sp. AK08-02 TaxID=3028654 RepID=UPI0029A95E18|nr:MFS transporter [Streptomyces sp. AK08-02]MDX3747750.1 MFS transporter [Streptomyces sp. AK08-02]